VLFADSVHGEKKKSFFGDFLPISKKLPAGRRTAEALALRHQHQEQSRWIPAFAGMTIKSDKLDSSFRWNDNR